MPMHRQKLVQTVYSLSAANRVKDFGQGRVLGSLHSPNTSICWSESVNRYLIYMLVGCSFFSSRPEAARIGWSLLIGGSSLSHVLTSYLRYGVLTF